MTSPISRLASAIARPATWTKQTFEMPSPIDASDLELLGTDYRGSRWYTAKRRRALGDLRELPGHFNTTTDALPSRPMFQETGADGEPHWVALECNPPGSWLQAKAGPVRRPRPRAAVLPIDVIGFAWLADKRPGGAFAIQPATRIEVGAIAAGLGSDVGPPPIVKAPEEAARGPEAILDRLRKAGATVRLGADGEHLVVVADRGTPQAGVVELVNLASRLLVGHLKGAPVMCEVGDHGKKPTPAVSIVLGGAAACAECLSTPDKGDR